MLAVLGANMEQRCCHIDRENQNTLRRAHPSAPLSTANPILAVLGVNLGLCGEKQAINCLSYGMTHSHVTLCQKYTASSSAFGNKLNVAKYV
jgi:hypothetical protein